MTTITTRQRYRTFLVYLALIFFGIPSPLLGNPKTGNHLFYGHTSDNFIIRWGFQDMCNHFFDPNTIPCSWPTKSGGISFNPADVEEGDIIFVRDINLFFQERHPYIKYPYILLTHGEYRDTCISSYSHYLDEAHIIAWFSIHPFKNAHKKFFPLPLGIRQDKKFYKNSATINTFIQDLRNNTPKTKLLCLNFDADRNPERQNLIELFASKSWCSKQPRRSFTDYLKEMATYKFVLCPRGWGPDSYRTWEALLVGTIPIVKRGQHDLYLHNLSNIDPIHSNQEKAFHKVKEAPSQLDRLYENLPVLIVDNWEDITQDFLRQKYTKITSKRYDLHFLYKEYWYEKIMKVRDTYFQKTISRSGIFKTLYNEIS